jgi:hypothetical protein
MALTGLVNAEGGGSGTLGDTGGAFTETSEQWWTQTTFLQTTDLGCGEYTLLNPNSYKAFKYKKQVGNETHLFCYREYKCDTFDTQGNPKIVYCLYSEIDSNNKIKVEQDCGKLTLGKSGRSECDNLDEKKPGDAWP